MTADTDAAPVASLPMYDIAEIRPAVERLWSAIARHASVDPTVFGWPEDHEGDWLRPGLVLGQSCGLPLAETLERRVGVVGAFTYAGVSDRRARYASVLVSHREGDLASFAGTRAAVNSWASLSGWASLGAAVATVAPGRPFFAEVTVTGAHVRSLAALREGRVDLAAVDGVTYALLRRHRPEALAGVVEIGRCPEIPCLPLITAVDADVGALRTAIAAALADPDTADARDALLVEGFVPLVFEDYLPVLDLRAAALQTVPRPSRR